MTPHLYRAGVSLAFILLTSFFLSDKTTIAQGSTQVAGMTPEQRTEMYITKLKTSLSLSEGQADSIKTLLDAETAARAAHDTTALRAIHATMTADISKILTAEQMVKYNQMMTQRQRR